MKILKYENKQKIYNEITKCTPYAKDKEVLYKTKCLDIYSFSVIIDWLNSLLISNKILNESNIYEEIKDGLIILKLIKAYKPDVEILGIFFKAIKKKCAIQNLEKALSIIYMNNPYYYSIVSSADIYEKKEKKVNMLLLQLFDKYEFQNLKKISIPLLNWYNHTLKKFSIPLSNGTIKDPFNVLNGNLCTKRDKNQLHYNNFNEMCTFSENKKNGEHFPTYIKNDNKSNILKKFANYVLFKDKQESNTIPSIVKDFSDGIKIFLIFYRYGYFTKEELENIHKSDIRNNFFILQNLLRKFNIPIILKNAYLNNPCEVSILLQLKYIQCFIHNSGYKKAIDLKNENSVAKFLLNQNKSKKDKKDKKDKKNEKYEKHNIQLKNKFDAIFYNEDKGSKLFDKNFNPKDYVKKVFEEYNNQNIQKTNLNSCIEKNKLSVTTNRKTEKHTSRYGHIEVMNDETHANKNYESETECSESIGNQTNSKMTKYMNSENQSLTFETDDESEEEMENVTINNKKNEKSEKIHRIKKEIKDRVEDPEEIKILLEEYVFKNTPKREIKKLFYEKIKEYMFSDTVNKSEKLKYGI